MNELMSQTNELDEQFGRTLNKLNLWAPIEFCQASRVCITY
jgi:hypothetical protein